MKFHALAELFPLLEGREFDELVADIRANGLREPIWMYQGQVLDGRNRCRACERLGQTPDTREYNGDDPLRFVLSLNLHRRHLTEGQKAVLALDLLPHFEAEAKKRQAHGQTAPGKTLPERIPEPSVWTGEAREQAADAVGVNPRYVSDAKRISEQAPELVPKMRAGEITVPQAMRELKERERETKRDQNRAAIVAAPEPTKITGVYSTIVIDPPWDWGDEGDQDQLGRARPTYGTMTLDQLLGLPVGEYAADDSHLYLWITNRSLPKGFAQS